MSILLNDNFDGGKILIKNADKCLTTEYNGPVGKAIIFPSTWIHKVEPITNGERYVLTAWAYGDI
jgi:predicted 2-oxoglutarate/Fe(II)-dependent dioxygenase YbiX